MCNDQLHIAFVLFNLTHHNAYIGKKCVSAIALTQPK